RRPGANPGSTATRSYSPSGISANSNRPSESVWTVRSMVPRTVIVTPAPGAADEPEALPGHCVDIEPDTIVANDERERGRAAGQRDRYRAGAAVLGGVHQRFLCDAEETERQIVRQQTVNAVVIERHRQPRARKFALQPLERRHQANQPELCRVQPVRHVANAAHDTLGVVERLARVLLDATGRVAFV